MFVLESEEDGGEYGFLECVLEVEVEILELLADEADGEYGDLLDDGVFASDVGSDFLGDAVPLVPWDFNAADCCDDLDGGGGTLAAALRTDFYGSSRVPSTRSLKLRRFGALRVYQR